MRKKYLIAGVVLALSLSMVGCGKDTSSTTADGTTGDVTTEAEVASDTDIEEATEEEVEEVSTWFSENGISFTEGEVSIPAYTYAKNEDGSEDDSVEMTQKDATYSEPSIDVSEPDADGNVTYTVTYSVRGTWSGMMAAGSGFTPRVYIKNYNFVDAYTGTEFPCADMTMEENSYATDSVVEVDGKEYKISTGQSFEFSEQEPSWSYFENNTKAKATIAYTFDITMVAVVPAEYDGLILALNGAGATEKDDLDTEMKEAQPLDGNVSDYIFKDVSYGTNMEWKEGTYGLTYDCSNSQKISYIALYSNCIRVEYYDEATGTEFEKAKKDDYIQIKLKDGKSINMSADISEQEIEAGAFMSNFVQPYFERSQVQSIIIGGEEFSQVKGSSRISYQTQLAKGAGRDVGFILFIPCFLGMNGVADNDNGVQI